MTGKLELIHLANSLLLTGKKVAVFCGAGISYNSNVPLVYPIVRGLLLRLGANEAEIEKITNAWIPFEVFMELFKEHIGIDPIFELFTDKVPNYDHKVLASLAKAGYCKLIVTTNFDTLIEQALDDEGLTDKIDFEVYATEEEFSTIAWGATLIKVVKIHGTASLVDSIKIIMSKIASSQVSIHLTETLERTFSNGDHQQVIVLGYSCSDHFDVTKILEDMTGPYKEVLFIEHNALKVAVDSWDAEDIRLKNTNNPFKGFDGSVRVNTETEHALRFLVLNLGLTPKPVTDSPDFDPDAVLDGVFKMIDVNKFDFIAPHTLGRLLIKSANYLSAETRMEQSLIMSATAADYFFVAQAYLNLGIINYRLARHVRAISMYKLALRILRQHNIMRPERYQKLIRANTLGNVGNILYAIRKLRFAEYFQLAALEIAVSEKLDQLIANTNGNLGIIYFESHDYSLALQFNEAALKKASEIGDPEGVARHNYNIGCCHMELGHSGRMHRYFRTSFEIFELMGRPDSIAYINLKWGKYYLNKRNYQKARAHLRKTLNAVEKMNGQLVQLDCYEYLGDVYAALGNKVNAIKYYELCMDSCKRSEVISFLLRAEKVCEKAIKFI